MPITDIIEGLLADSLAKEGITPEIIDCVSLDAAPDDFEIILHPITDPFADEHNFHNPTYATKTEGGKFLVDYGNGKFELLTESVIKPMRARWLLCRDRIMSLRIDAIFRKKTPDEELDQIERHLWDSEIRLRDLKTEADRLEKFLALHWEPWLCQIQEIAQGVTPTHKETPDGRTVKGWCRDLVADSKKHTEIIAEITALQTQISNLEKSIKTLKSCLIS